MFMENFKIQCREKSVGKSVRIGEGTEISCDKLFLGDGVIIGKNSRISGKSVSIGDHTIINENFTGVGLELFEIGRLCRIEKNSVIKSRYVKIGNETRTLGSIEVGGGGWQDEESKFIVGDGCQIGDKCIINVARPVVFENKSALATNSFILTHGFWQSVLKGYGAEYGPVTLGENSWVTINCTVLPNVTVGKNSIVAAGAVVTKSVPPNCLAGGVPARIIKENYPKEPSDKEKTKIILNIVKGYKGADASRIEKGIIILNGKTVFDFRNLMVSGACSKESERLRNHLRRRGIVFGFKDYDADPYASRYWCVYE